MQQSYSQSALVVGTLPEITITKGFSNNYSLTFNLESRQELIDTYYGDLKSLDFNFILMDFSIIGAKKIDLNKTIAIGYQSRFESGKLIHRSIQQFNITSAYSDYRLGHRIVTDQTFEKDEKVEFRFRYRITGEFPLNGLAVDPKEFYFKVGNEYVNAIQSNLYDMEIRATPMLGYTFNDDNKLEGGIDYRLSGFLNGAIENVFWINLNWYLKF